MSPAPHRMDHSLVHQQFLGTSHGSWGGMLACRNWWVQCSGQRRCCYLKPQWRLQEIWRVHRFPLSASDNHCRWNSWFHMSVSFHPWEVAVMYCRWTQDTSGTSLHWTLKEKPEQSKMIYIWLLRKINLMTLRGSFTINCYGSRWKLSDYPVPGHCINYMYWWLNWSLLVLSKLISTPHLQLQ